MRPEAHLALPARVDRAALRFEDAGPGRGRKHSEARRGVEPRSTILQTVLLPEQRAELVGGRGARSARARRAAPRAARSMKTPHAALRISALEMTCPLAVNGISAHSMKLPSAVNGISAHSMKSPSAVSGDLLPGWLRRSISPAKDSPHASVDRFESRTEIRGPRSHFTFHGRTQLVPAPKRHLSKRGLAPSGGSARTSFVPPENGSRVPPPSRRAAGRPRSFAV